MLLDLNILSVKIQDKKVGKNMYSDNQQQCLPLADSEDQFLKLYTVQSLVQNRYVLQGLEEGAVLKLLFLL